LTHSLAMKDHKFSNEAQGSLNMQLQERVTKRECGLRLRQCLFNPYMLILLLIVLVSIFFRFINIDTKPLWYADEGANLNIAWNLINGRMQLYAVTYPFMPHPPLFYLLLGGALKVFGYNLVVGRLITATLGVLTTIVLYFLGKTLWNKKLGLISSFLFAIFPLAILYNRWVFDFDLLQFFSIFTLFASIKYVKTGRHQWFYAASLGAAAACITDLSGVGLVFGLIYLVFANREIKLILKGIAIGFGAFATYLLTMISLQKDALFYDFQKILNGGGTSVSLIDNFRALTSLSPWILVGLLGILSYPILFRKKNETIALLSVAFSFILFSLVLFPIHEPHIRGIIQLFPFFTFGMAILMLGILQKIIDTFKAKLTITIKSPKRVKLVVTTTWVCCFALLALPFGSVILSDGNAVLTGFPSGLNVLCAQSSTEAFRVTDYINSQTNPDDLVIASPQISWLLQSRYTDIEQSIAVTHDPVPFYPTDMADSRFVFNCSYQNAKFVVSDLFSSLWNIPELKNIQANWTLVYNFGGYAVYQNPRFE
jgi:hypothetical protein